MTNQQLWLSIGIPSVLIVLSWMQTNVRLSDFKAEMLRELGSLDKIFERRFKEMDTRLDKMDTRLDKIDTRLDRIDADLKHFYGTDQKLEGRMDELSARIK